MKEEASGPVLYTGYNSEHLKRKRKAKASQIKNSILGENYSENIYK